MFLEFLEATTRAGAIRTLESLVRIEEGAQGGRLPCPPGSLLTGFFPIPGVPPGGHIHRRRTVSYRRREDLLLAVLAGHYTRARARAGDTHVGVAGARIEEGAQGGALIECVTTTRTAKDGTVTITVRERFTPPDWRADGWFLERRHPTDWSRRTELVVADHEQAAEADPLVGVHDELRLARQKQQGKSV